MYTSKIAACVLEDGVQKEGFETILWWSDFPIYRKMLQIGLSEVYGETSREKIRMVRTVLWDTPSGIFVPGPLAVMFGN